MNENLKIRVTSDSSQAKRDIGGFDDKMKQTIKSVVGITAALMAAKKAFDFFAQSTKMAMEQEKIFRKLQSAVEITGKSWGAASVELDRLFASLQRTTQYGDTESAEVFQRIITLTGDYDKALTGLPIALDLAASGLFDAGTAARYVGMAMTGNIEMLGRYISEFKTTTNEQLKNMDASEKVAYAVDVLRKKFGGLAEKELDTTAGQVKQLSNYWGDLREAIGDRFLPVINSVAGSLTGIIKALLNVRDSTVMTNIAFTETIAKSTQSTYEFKRLSAELVRLAEKEKKSAWELEQYKKTVDEINADYGNYLSHLISEKDAYFDIAENLKVAKTNLQEYWKIKREQAVTADIQSEMDALNKRNSLLQWSIDSLTDFDATTQTYVKNSNGYIMSVEAMNAELENNNASMLLLEERYKIAAGAIDKTDKAFLSFIETIGAMPESVVTNVIINYIRREISEPEFIEPTQKEKESLQEHIDALYSAVPAMEIKIDPKYLEDEIGQMSPLLNTFGNTMSSMFQTAMGDGFDNIGEMWIDLLKRMAADLAATGFLKLLGSIFNFSTGGVGFFANIFHRGGEITNSGGHPVKGASGLDFTVPSGFPNDSFPILVESGEHVSVTPSGQSGRTEELLEALINEIRVKPVANVQLLEDIDISRSADRGALKREYS